MKFSLLLNLFIFLLSVSYATEIRSTVEENATLKLESGATLNISESSILKNKGTINTEEAPIINVQGTIENDKTIELNKITEEADINLILAGEGSVQITQPNEGASIKSIKTIANANQTFLGSENANSIIDDLQITSSSIIEKESNLTLDIQKSIIEGTLYLDGGDIVFSKD